MNDSKEQSYHLAKDQSKRWSIVEKHSTPES